VTTWQSQQQGYSYHDAVIQRLSNMPPFIVWTLDAQTNIVPWMQVDMVQSGVLRELVISPHNLQGQIDTIGLQVAYWGRLIALQARVVSVAERRYRVWRSGMEWQLYYEGMKPKMTIDGLAQDIPEPTKKPTKVEVEAMIRLLPDYGPMYNAQEAAIESRMACDAIYEGFRAKKEVLRADVWHSADGQVHRRSL
jgi:hypothetical protein